jgi:hypothetical protein
MMKPIILLTALAASSTAFAPTSRFGVRSASISVAAEWKPSEGEKWEEKDFEGELKKLEKEAEDRLDAKIAEMMTNIDTVGSK